VSKKCPSDFHEMRGFVREGLEEKIRRGLGKEDLTFRQTNLDSIKLLNRGMGLGREAENREDRGEISMIVTGDGDEDTMVYGERGTAERKVESDGRKEGMRLQEKIGRGKSKGVSERMLKGNKGKVQGRENTNRVGERKRKRFFEKRGVKREEVKEKGREEENWIYKIEERD